MKKPKTYNLKRVIYETINKLAIADGRSDSDWLNIHLGSTLPTKEASKPKTALVKSEVIYPLYLNVDAWDKWIAFRKLAKFKKYKSDATMKKLAKMGDSTEQFLIVQQSIDNEYQGLFALKGNNNGHQSASKKKSAYDRAREANSEYRQPDEREVVMGTDGGHMGRTVDEGEGRATIEHVDNEPFVDYE